MLQLNFLYLPKHLCFWNNKEKKLFDVIDILEPIQLDSEWIPFADSGWGLEAMDGLPEDQRDDDNESRSSSSQSSPEERPSSPEERPDTPQHHEGGAAALLPERAPAPRNELGAVVAPLLLRHASVSSLDESSQKYKSSVSTFSDTGAFCGSAPKFVSKGWLHQ